MAPERAPVRTAAETRAAEEDAIRAGTPASDLMERAGRAVADAAVPLAAGAPVIVLCGTGNNGGDGYVAARRLAEAGLTIGVASLGSPRADSAVRAASGWTGPVVPLAEVAIAPRTLVVDALFGTGLTRDLGPDLASLFARIQDAGCPVLAVDIPSGLDADTGAVRGAVLPADRTVTFATLKPGHLLHPGSPLCGEVVVADIGLPAPVATGTEANGPGLWLRAFPRPGIAGHKYGRGHALVVSGGPGQTGAARLTARGALRAGAGLVSLFTSARALAVNAAHVTAVMLRVCDDPDDFADLLADARYNALALGPGLGVGAATRAWVTAALEADRATVLGADAITSFAGAAGSLARLLDGRSRPVVVTPHEGEFARLFDGDRAVADAASKLDRARLAAARLGATVVLKGPDTVIAAADGRAAINRNGSPYLATAGSGDVLTGIAAGLLAQGAPAFEAACAAVWLHAETGRRFGPGLIAEDLPDGLPGVLATLLA